jgi:hypothetical protein
VEELGRRLCAALLRVDGQREHDRAIRVVDDERRGDRLAGRVVDPREPHAALLADGRRDLLEQAHRLRIGERRRLVALGPLEPRQPAQRAHALAERGEVVAERGDHAGRVRAVGRRERQRDPARAARRGRALDGEPGRREPLHEVRADARRIGQRLELDQIPRRALVDQLARERRAGAILPAGPREQVERRRARAGIADHPQLARVEQRDPDGAAVERRQADDVAGLQGAGRVGLDRPADEHVQLGAERRVVRAPPREQPVGTAEQCSRAGGGGERAPLRLERAELHELAHNRDLDRHAHRDVTMEDERVPPGGISACVAIGNAVRCDCHRREARTGGHPGM